jgi:hypothetical protein
MTNVTISRCARRELLNRMGRYAAVTAILIIGPLLNDCRAPDSLEEAWLLERLYGPPQRWVLDIVPLHAIANVPVEPGETLHVQDVAGMRVAVLTSKTVPQLQVDLRGDSLRVYEVDAY